MDYEQKYKEVLERAREYYDIDDDNTLPVRTRGIMEHLFPELKESEDERIRKWLIEYVKCFVLETEKEVDKKAVLAWLEKHKEQKPVQDREEREYVRTLKSLIADFLRDKEDVNRGYYQDIYDWLDGRHIEQKPADAKIDNSRKNVAFPFNAKVKDSGKVVTIIDGQLSFDGKQWIRFSSNKDDGFKVYRPEDLVAVQQPVEWSDDFQENIRILLHDKLTWRSDDGKMSSAVLIDDKTLKDIISGIWFYVGKEALKYPRKELNVSEWSKEDEKRWKDVLRLIMEADDRYIREQGRSPFSSDILWLKSLPERITLQPK